MTPLPTSSTPVIIAGLPDQVTSPIVSAFVSGPQQDAAILHAATVLRSVELQDEASQLLGLESLQRSVECAFAVAGNDIAVATRILNVAVTSALFTDDLVRFYLARTSLISSPSITTVRNSDAWEQSCDDTLTTLTGTPSSVKRSWGDGKARKVATTTDLCNLNDVDLYYINGIQTESNDANIAATSLAALVSQEAGKILRIQLIHNPNDSLIVDLYETLLLKLTETSPGPVLLTLRDVFQLVLIGTSLVNPAMAPVALALLRTPEVISLLVRRASTAANQQVTATILNRIEDSVFHGRSVALVAHSQGNLYMNAAFRSTSPDVFPFVRAFSVATPASQNVGRSQYVTRVDDIVIGAVLNSLPGNVVGAQDGDIFHHSFIASYLNDPAIRPAITSNVIAMYSDLINSPGPAAIGGTGLLTVTMTWGPEPDVDLHVFEPSGSHVFYGRLSGVQGTLDHDDVTSFGPENYVVACSQSDPFSVEGTYRIGANYYEGSSPEVATISITACGIVRFFSVVLPAERGSSGDGSPVPVAIVTVTIPVSPTTGLPETPVCQITGA